MQESQHSFPARHKGDTDKDKFNAFAEEHDMCRNIWDGKVI